MPKKISALLIVLFIIAVPVIIYLTLSHLPENWFRIILTVHLTFEATIATYLLVGLFALTLRALREPREERFSRARNAFIFPTE